MRMAISSSQAEFPGVCTHLLMSSLVFLAVNIFLLAAKLVAYAATGSKAVLASLADSAGKFMASSRDILSKTCDTL